MRAAPLSAATVALAFGLAALHERAVPLVATHLARAAWVAFAAALVLLVARRAGGALLGALAGGMLWLAESPATRLPWPPSALGRALDAAFVATSPLDALHDARGVWLVAACAFLGAMASLVVARVGRPST